MTVYEAELVDDAPTTTRKKALLLDRPWVVLSMLFLVTLFLGFPVLWRSKGFSAQGKIVWTILVSLWSILIFYVFFVIMAWSYGRVSEAIQGM